MFLAKANGINKWAKMPEKGTPSMFLSSLSVVW